MTKEETAIYIKGLCGGLLAGVACVVVFGMFGVLTNSAAIMFLTEGFAIGLSIPLFTRGEASTLLAATGALITLVACVVTLFVVSDGEVLTVFKDLKDIKTWGLLGTSVILGGGLVYIEEIRYI